MNRSDLMLAAMAAGAQSPLTPVQLQKLMFLLDQNVADDLGAPHFCFYAHSYGPFDPGVYEEVRSLSSNGLAQEVATTGTVRRYMLTEGGLHRGKQVLESIPRDLADYIVQLSAWVRSLSFAQLVSAIYREYPEMRKNSVFKDASR